MAAARAPGEPTTATDGRAPRGYVRLIFTTRSPNLRHLRAAPRRRRERAATGPPGPRAARRPPLSRSLGPHMARERTHRRRRGARVPSHCVAHTPAHSAPHDRSKVHAGRSRPGCVTVAGRLPRRRAEPGVHLPRAIGAPPHTAHGPGSRLDCRTQAAPSRAGFGGWVGGWGARSGEARTARPQGEHVPHEPASGGRWKNMPHGLRGHVPASRVPASGEAHVPLVLASGGQWEARDVRPPPPPST